MKANFLQVLIILYLFFIPGCKKENSDDCKKRFYYYSSGKIALTETFNKGVISFYDTLSADTMNSILKKYQGIHYLPSVIKGTFTTVSIDSKSCSETSQLFSVIKKDPRISNCNKYMTGDNGLEVGMYDVFVCQLKSSSTIDQLNEMVANTRTTILKYNPSLQFYLIRADKNSGGDALDISDKFYESGYFEYAEPDFIIAMELSK
jgi:hypothetical protein